jgi:subtilisin-like proprotein convertase family protein
MVMIFYHPLYTLMRHTSLLTCLLFMLANYVNAQSYAGTGGIIADDGSINDFTIDINDLTPDTLSEAHGLVSVCLKITHTWVSDLDIRLISPAGDNMMLTSGIGADTDDYDNTCFTMTVPVHILDGAPPYDGAYRPFTSLGNANQGQSGNGTWTLRILDTYAYADGGEVISWTINFGSNAPVTEAFAGTKLPVITLTTDNITIPNEPKIDGYIRVFDNASGHLNYPMDIPVFESNIAIEIRGSSSQRFPKKSFGFETQDADGEDLETELLGLPKEDDWILYAPYTDKSFLRDAITYELGDDLGGYAPGTRLCELFLNGDYQGVYWLEEKIKRDKNRVDIKKLNPVDTLGDALTGGYLLKVDRDDGEGSYFFSNHAGTFENMVPLIVYEDPEGQDLHPKQKAYISNYFHQFESALYGDDFKDAAKGYRAYVDVNSAIDYFIICELGHNVDAYRLSTFFYKDRNSVDSLFHFGPLWDFNLAFGNVDYCESQWVEGWTYVNSGGCSNTPRWWARFLEDPYYQDRLKCRYDSLRQTVLSMEAILHYVDSTGMLLQEASDRNYDRWPILSRYVWPNYFIGDTYQDELNYLKQWITGRLDWMDANMPGECLPVSSIPAVDPQYMVLSPNPATGSFSILIRNNELQNVDVRISNVNGTVVKTKKSFSTGQQMDISYLAAGIYIVTVTDEIGGLYQEKLVIRE